MNCTFENEISTMSLRALRRELLDAERFQPESELADRLREEIKLRMLRIKEFLPSRSPIDWFLED